MNSIKLERGSTLVLATHNAGKLAEFATLLADFGIKVVSAGELNLPEPEETATTFAGNAAIKALAAAKAANLPALADDSGLCVAALDGAPGIYSARWAGPNKDFAGAWRVLKKKLGKANATHGLFAYCVWLCLMAAQKALKAA